MILTIVDPETNNVIQIVDLTNMTNAMVCHNKHFHDKPYIVINCPENNPTITPITLEDCFKVMNLIHSMKCSGLSESIKLSLDMELS